MTDGTALREIAAEILTEILEKGQYTHLALFQALSKYQYLEKSDRSFLKRIVDGTVEYKIQIDYIDEQKQISHRQLWPFALGYFNDKMLLAAWCELREDFRNFRLDRIQTLILTEQVYPQFKRHLFQQWCQKEFSNS